MLYIFSGSDTLKVAEKANTLILSLRTKKPDASVVFVSEEITDTLLDELTAGQGLFERKLIAIFEHVFDDVNSFEHISDHLVQLKASENIFIFKEGALLKKPKTAAEKYAEKFFEFMPAEKTAKPNDFVLADALARRDKKTAWVLYREAVERGSAPEALHGMLFWKVKTMLQKKSFGAFSESELRAALQKLVTIYHEVRRGRGEMAESVEEFVLGV